MEPHIRTVTLPSGERVPALGIGTWRMGESRARRAEEIATLRLAVERGVRLIDTAEMYGEGSAETLIGEAIRQLRAEVFLVSKVYPHNAGREGAVAACERSLMRLGTDCIDLYLLHWRGDIPLAETLEAFLQLQRQGKIRHYGVSNLDLEEMRELWDLEGGRAVATDQVLYNLSHRGIELHLLPWLHERHIPIMAYSPLDQGKLASDRNLIALAERSGTTPSQLAIGWLLAQEGVIAIPKTSRRDRLSELIDALEQPLSPEQLRELDRVFPRPAGVTPLEMI